MKPAIELISTLVFWALLPIIIVVYGLLIGLLTLGYFFSYIFDWADARRTNLINRIILPLIKR